MSVDAIDFPCSPVWVRHYAARGVTADYPPEMDYQAPEPPALPIPDPLRSLQQYQRFYHTDIDRMDTDEIRRELRQVLRFEDADDWFAERILRLRAGLHQFRDTPPEPVKAESEAPEAPKPQRRGIEL